MRGRRNEPAFIAHTARKLSEALDLAVDEVLATVDRNARSLFGSGSDF